MSCTSGNDLFLGTVGVASVNRLEITIEKDDVAWAGVAGIDFVFRSPDRLNTFTRAGSLVTPDAGIWYYDTVVTDLIVAGDWTVGLTVTDTGGAVTKYPYEIGLAVTDAQ